ncbi:MAG: hypothetical protein K9I68_01515 [Bacteroidales bacterium]|nr:hypothetical protein [Bacteroidales bacterium]MCF8337065.1 hypothetical protein [Bacteroidales bacterium]
MSYYYQQAQKNTSRGPFEDIWNWMVSHAGVHGDRSYDLPCGPCPGICIGIRFTPVDDDYLLTQEEYENGKRLLEIGFFNDSTLGVNFKHKGFVENDTLFVDQDYNIGDEASELYNKDSIIIEKGAYPVTYSQSKNGSTIVDIKSY